MKNENGLENWSLKMLPSAYGLGLHFQDLGHSFSPYGPPSRQITYIHLRPHVHVHVICMEYYV